MFSSIFIKISTQDEAVFSEFYKSIVFHMYSYLADLLNSITFSLVLWTGQGGEWLVSLFVRILKIDN